MALKQTQETTTTSEETSRVQPAKQIHPLWWILATAVALCAIIALAAAAKQLFYRGLPIGSTQTNTNMARTPHRFNDRHHMRGGRMNDNQEYSDNSTRISGVVTAIDGTKLTIAGYCTSKIAETNDKTQYYGAAQPVKVNDTVMITGTTSGDSFTASRITIRRQ